MHSEEEYVQPLVLLRSGTHEDAVRATASACVQAYVTTGASNPNWGAWLAGQFTKTVRRAKNGQFAAATNLATGSAVCGTASALALDPVRYRDLPQTVRKLQVSGTDFPRTGWQPLSALPDGVPVLVVNEDLNMSTGKVAAQASHALLGWYLSEPESIRAVWRHAEMPFVVTGAHGGEVCHWHASEPQLIIEDAGRTEIPSGSLSVAVYICRHA